MVLADPVPKTLLPKFFFFFFSSILLTEFWMRACKEAGQSNSDKTNLKITEQILMAK